MLTDNITNWLANWAEHSAERGQAVWQLSLQTVHLTGSEGAMKGRRHHFCASRFPCKTNRETWPVVFKWDIEAEFVPQTSLAVTV